MTPTGDHAAFGCRDPHSSKGTTWLTREHAIVHTLTAELQSPPRRCRNNAASWTDALADYWDHGQVCTFAAETPIQVWERYGAGQGMFRDAVSFSYLDRGFDS